MTKCHTRTYQTNIKNMFTALHLRYPIQAQNAKHNFLKASRQSEECSHCFHFIWQDQNVWRTKMLNWPS
uniref:Uncharacterized protein n=1 Tax=Arundo donax TaxID=35708 RepID=A0A0A9FU07_ARUDO